VHDEVRADLMRADARALSATLTRDLIAPLIALNMPGAPMPRLTLMVEEPDDMAALADQLAKLVPLGVPIPQRWVREKWGIPEVAPDEPVLGAPAMPPAPDATGQAEQAAHRRMQSAHAQAAEPTPDAIDELVAEALSGWEPQMQPMVDPLQALLDRAAAEGWTAQQLIDALPGVIDDMDAARLTDALARAAFVARLAGVHGREPGRE
jgi:phage gp29-like protein